MTGTESLSPAQRGALLHVSGLASRAAAGRRAALDGLLHRTGASRSRFEDALARVRAHARVALHFHPDRPSAGGRSVAENLLLDGIYRNQFETGISNGGLSAFPGGDRDRWEADLFGGATMPAASRTGSGRNTAPWTSCAGRTGRLRVSGPATSS